MTEPRDRMKDFLRKHQNSLVCLDALDDENKETFVMIDTFRFFREFLPIRTSLERAVSNAAAHRKSGYINYSKRIMRLGPLEKEKKQ